MAIEIKVPTVGESITEVTISSWRKKEGDLIKMNEILCELESDKATFELNAEADGILHIVAQEGDTLAIGALICTLDNAAGNSTHKTEVPKTEITNAETSATSQKQEPGKVVEMKVPTVGESITEVTIGTWNKKDGDSVNLNEILCEIESDKATFELAAEASGILKIIAKEGQTLPIGGLICSIQEGNSQGTNTTTPKSDAPVKEEIKNSVQSNEVSYASGHPSPTAQKILTEKEIEAKDVKGTGVDGRITKDDAVKAEKTPTNQPAIQKSENKPELKKEEIKGDRTQRREKMTSLRKTVARRLVAVKNETAMLTTFNEVDMKPVMELRAKYKDKFKEKHGVGLGFMSFFTKAVCIALKEWPAVNAMMDGDEIVYNNFCDISVAVSAPKGLVVPIIRNAEKMSFSQIEAEIVRLAGKAKENKLTIDEMTGGTFTITNGGIFGSMLSTPIINAPQTAILGMHNIVDRAVVVDGQIVIRPIMYLALSYDHRIIDGREAVSFVVRVKQLLEDPSRLLLDI